MMTADQISPSGSTKIWVLAKEDQTGEKEKRKKGKTNYIEQRRSWTANSSSARQEIAYVHWKSKSLLLRFQGASPLVSPFQADIILRSTLRSPQVAPFLSAVPTKTVYTYCSPLQVLHEPANPPRSDHTNGIWWVQFRPHVQFYPRTR